MGMITEELPIKACDGLIYFLIEKVDLAQITEHVLQSINPQAQRISIDRIFSEKLSSEIDPSLVYVYTEISYSALVNFNAKGLITNEYLCHLRRENACVASGNP